MSSYESYQNGLSYDPKHLISCSTNINISNLRKPLRCNISLLLLFFFQIISTILMLFSLSYTFELVSAEEYIMDVTMNNVNKSSGIINHDAIVDNSLEEVLYRFRRLSVNKTWILTADNANFVCKSGNYSNRFKYLTKMRMANCGMFDVDTVIYPFLISDTDLINVVTDTNFPTYKFSVNVTDEYISKLPSQVLILTHTGEIHASLKSTQSLIVDKFSTEHECVSVLKKMIEMDDSVLEAIMNLKDILVKGHCDVSMKPGRLKSKINCGKCEVAYKNWLCTQYFDMFTPIVLPSSEHLNYTLSPQIPNDYNQNQSALIGIKSCPAWCSKVETDCVYLTPAQGNGGEPAFLCDESHYHHNARYRLSAKFECGAELPWKFCCYSQSLLDQWQERPIADRYSQSGCASTQTKCLIKIIKAVYQIKWSPLSPLNKKVINNNRSNSDKNNCSHSSFNQRLNLIISISSMVLYFYTDFSIR